MPNVSAMASAIARWKSLIRFVLGAVAVGLGFWGWTIKTPPLGWEDWFNNAFRTLQLVTLQFPREVQSDIPWQLQFARFLLPTMAAVESFRLIVSTVRSPYHQARVTMARDHTVVVGQGRMARGVAKAMARRDRFVVMLASKASPADVQRLEIDGITVLDGESAEASTWERARVSRAREVFVMSGTDVQNLESAVVAIDVLRSAVPDRLLTLVVQIDNDDLAERFDASMDQAISSLPVRYHRMSTFGHAARDAFMHTLPILQRALDAGPSHVVIFGLAHGGMAVLREALSMAQDDAEHVPVIGLFVDDGERAAVERFQRDHPDLPLVADIRIVTLDEGESVPADGALGAYLASTPPVCVAFVCQGEDEAVVSVLTLRRTVLRLAHQRFPIHGYRAGRDAFYATLGKAAAKGDAMGDLHAFGGEAPKSFLKRITDDSQDGLAMVLHDSYRATLAAAGTEGATADRPWSDLPENMREANRAAAAHAAIKLHMLGLAPDAPPPIDLTEAQVEMLARVEHRRWMANRILGGWRHGPRRDNEARLHPDIVPYDDLPERSRELDREGVRSQMRLVGANAAKEQASHPHKKD